MNGIDILAIKDDKDEYLKSIKVANQTSPNKNPKYIFKQNKIPTYVATPLPPLNFNHTGKTCPKNTLNDDIYLSLIHISEPTRPY